MLVLIVGPSGAGKDTLLDRARAELADDARFRFVRRAVTRPAESGGEDHEAIDLASFERRRSSGAFALWWEAHGLRYGVPAGIESDISAGRVVVASVSRGVVADASRRFPSVVVEITAPPDLLAARLCGRGREGPARIAERLDRSPAWDANCVAATIVNDGPIEAGAARLTEFLRACAETLAG